jgi:hypothetical protein
VEFYRDIRPLLQRSCTGACHTQAVPSGQLVLEDLSLQNDLPGDYRRLCDDRDAQWGYPPVITNGTWRQTNASRYVRRFQSRRSLLAWKVFGERLDGWTNADHPTESVPGNAATLPAGAVPNEADLDFTGTIMPPPGSGVPDLTIDEKMTFARWIDLGCPIDTAETDGNAGLGWFLDEVRPTVAVSSPRPGLNTQPINVLRFGLADANSGVDLTTLSVTADFVVENRPPGAELADLAMPTGDGVWTVFLSESLVDLASELRVEVKDNQGNVTRVRQSFNTALGLVFADSFESGDASAWSSVLGN